MVNFLRDFKLNGNSHRKWMKNLLELYQIIRDEEGGTVWEFIKGCLVMRRKR